jgi:hypothetical protein
MVGLLGVALASSAVAFTASSSAAETSDALTENSSPVTEASSSSDMQEKKVDICHKNENQPGYVSLNIPVQAVLAGHLADPAHLDDIIPSFTYMDKDKDKGESTFPGQNLDKADYFARDCQGKDEDWKDSPSWITINGSAVCNTTSGLWDISWTAANSSPAGKTAMVNKVSPANASPQTAEIPSGGSKAFTASTATAGAQTLTLDDVDFTEPGQGPKDRTYAGSFTIEGTCTKTVVPSTPPAPAPAAAAATATPSATVTPTPTATPVITPEPAVTEAPEPVVITPEAATAPTAVNAGDGSSAPQSGLTLWAMALAAVAAIGAAGAGVRLAVTRQD